MDVPKFFGIDIGDSGIKFAQTDFDGTNATLVNLGRTNIPAEVFKDNEIQDFDLLFQRVADLVKKSKIDTKNCVISIPEASIFSRLVNLPKMPEAEVSEAIYWSMKPIIPVSLETVNISFLKVNDAVVNGKDSENWYAVAAPKDLIDKYEKASKAIGLNLLAIETESLANTRSVIFNYNEMTGDNLIVDFGARTSNVIVVRDKKVTFSQTVELGSNELTRAVASDFGIDLAQAESYKVLYGLTPQGNNDKLIKSLIPVLDVLVGEISRTITYSKDKMGIGAINKIYYTGGGANLKGMPNYVTSKLNIEGVVADPFKRAKLSGNVKNLLQATQVTSVYNIAFGLSLKGLIDE